MVAFYVFIFILAFFGLIFLLTLCGIAIDKAHRLMDYEKEKKSQKETEHD